MAIKNLFAEIDNALGQYVRETAAEKQSKQYVHVVNYTKEWVKDLIKNIMVKDLMNKDHGSYQFSKAQADHVKKLADAVFPKVLPMRMSRTKAEDVAKRTIEKSGFKKVNHNQYTKQGLNFILTDSALFDKEDKPKENYYAIRGGATLKVIYFMNYPMHLATPTAPDADMQFNSALIASVLFHTYKEIRKQLPATSATKLDAASGTDGPGIASGSVHKTGFRFERERHHAGSMVDPTDPVATADNEGMRSDTTVRLIDFLEKMQKGEEVRPEVKQESQKYKDHRAEVRSIINERFNTAYKISGYSEIDIFDVKPEILKDISIQIFVGDASHRDLMALADKGDPIDDTTLSFDRFMKEMEEDLLAGLSDPDRELSMSMTEMVRRGVFASIAKNMKTASGMPDMRFKVNKKLFRDAQYKHSESAKRKGPSSKSSVKKVRSTGGRKIPMTRVKKRGPRVMGVESNPLALESLLNQLLPKVVASRMTPPALQYRTGRFAQSVEVDDVMIGPRGGTQVNYTYMRDPYETFEPGNRQGSVYRDPRKIIGESVRGIAQSIMGDKFIKTRRV